MSEEHVCSKDEIIGHLAYEKFGVCDVALIIHSIKREKYTIILGDEALVQYARKKGISVISMGEIIGYYLTQHPS